MAAIPTDTNWNELASRVDAGELSLDRGTAARCAQHCADLILRLEALIPATRELGEIDGLGPLPSGVALAAKFGRKASGGAYSMDRALADHIEVVHRMQQVFEKIEARYSAADEGAATAITGAGSGS